MSTLVAQTISNGTVSTSSANVIQGSAKAWVNFDGTASGTISPRASYNVSSVTKNGTGDYTVNFTNAFADANYSIVASSNSNPSFGPQGMVINFSTLSNNTVAPTTTAARITCWQQGTGAGRDNTYICASFFR